MPIFFSSKVQDLIARMLELDPDKRITIPEILDHPWLARNFDSCFDSGVTMSQDTDSLDDVVVDKCASLFSYPFMDIMQLRHSIKNDFGYLRATYRILCANPSLFSVSFSRSIKKLFNDILVGVDIITTEQCKNVRSQTKSFIF